MQNFIYRFTLLAISFAVADPSALAAQTPEISPWYLRVTPMGNEAWRIAVLFTAILVGMIGGKLLKHLLATSSKRENVKSQRYAAIALHSLSRVATSTMSLIGLRVGVQFLDMPEHVQTIVDTVIAIMATIIVAWTVYLLVDVLDAIMSTLAERTESKLDDMLRPLVRTSARATVVVLALVQIATILSDKPMTSIIAGLGVGGLAVGLAAQDMVKNFFGSLMIFSDHPFEMGDYIEAGGHAGNIETVGFRSTRLRTLDGHLVTIPNGNLANMIVVNVSQRPFLKRVFNVGLTYDMSPEKVELAMKIIKDILSDHMGMSEDKPPLVNFTEFMDSALNIQVIYWHFPADWTQFRALNNDVNMKVLQRFNAECIEFAFPTQTVHVAGSAASGPQ